VLCPLFAPNIEADVELDGVRTIQGLSDHLIRTCEQANDDTVDSRSRHVMLLQINRKHCLRLVCSIAAFFHFVHRQ